MRTKSANSFCDLSGPARQVLGLFLHGPHGDYVGALKDKPRGPDPVHCGPDTSLVPLLNRFPRDCFSRTHFLRSRFPRTCFSRTCFLNVRFPRTCFSRIHFLRVHSPAQAAAGMDLRRKGDQPAGDAVCPAEILHLHGLLIAGKREDHKVLPDPPAGGCGGAPRKSCLPSRHGRRMRAASVWIRTISYILVMPPTCSLSRRP